MEQEEEEDRGDVNEQPQHQDGQVQPQPELEPQPQPQPRARARARAQPPPQQPQPCPRCESRNTKFCYYNNYSLSQPRYYCKTCRRYWTQGGTMRNVPIGGGGRKEKRAKSSSSSSSSAQNPSRLHSQPQPPPPPQEVVQTQPNLAMVIRAKNPSSSVASPSPPVAVASISPYYQGSGGSGRYLSSLAPIHCMNPSRPFNQSLKVGGSDVGGSSNSGLNLSGFNVASLDGSQHQQQERHIRPSHFYQTGNRDKGVESLFPTNQGLIPSSSMANTNAASHPDWPQSFTNNASHRASDAPLWSRSTINTTPISGNSERNVSAGSSSSIQKNQWPELPGYDPRP